MCKFHIMGMCTKGQQCLFAHDMHELKPLPDLTCTKLCKTLIDTGKCENKDCTYAHNQEELRHVDAAIDRSIFVASQKVRSNRGRGEPKRTARAPAKVALSRAQDALMEPHPAQAGKLEFQSDDLLSTRQNHDTGVPWHMKAGNPVYGAAVPYVSEYRMFADGLSHNFAGHCIGDYSSQSMHWDFETSTY